jgi:ATP citrate (pro-S)-lyase
MAEFVGNLYDVYRQQHFTYLEINPLVVTDTSIFILDLAAKVSALFHVGKLLHHTL